MRIITGIQNTDEWHHARLGLPTASNFGKIFTADMKPSKSRKDYMYQLAGEIITGKPAEGFKNQRMLDGLANEKYSIAAYEFTMGCRVDRVGFCLHDSGLFGGSPDGLVGDDGGIETKDTSPHIQAKRLDKGWTGSEHHRQVNGLMLITGRRWWDLVSHCQGMKQVRVRFEWDNSLMDEMQKQLTKFNFELNHLVKKIS